MKKLDFNKNPEDFLLLVLTAIVLVLMIISFTIHCFAQL